MIHLRLLTVLLLAVCALLAVEDDPVLKERVKYDDAVAKLRKGFDDGIAKERAKAIPLLAVVAKKQVVKGDMPGAGRAWKEILRLDEQHAEARQFFTSLGTLDKVLGEIEAEESASSDLLGDSAGPAVGKPWEGNAVVRADKPLALGDLPAGTKITLQYQSGMWTFRQGAMNSPDDEGTPAAFRMALASAQGLITELPPGTAKSVWTWTAPNDTVGAVLRLSRSGGRAPAGSVTYRITVAKPKTK